MINDPDKIKKTSLKCSDINIRNPYILFEYGVYYSTAHAERISALKPEDFENPEELECFRFWIMTAVTVCFFDDGKKLMLTYHSPNESGSERRYFVEISDNGDSVSVK